MSSGDASARLFVALELPDPPAQALARWAAALESSDPALRAVRADALHATLCFLGQRPVAEIDAIAAACAEAVGPPVLELATGGLVGFPPRRPRVLAVELEDRSGGLARLEARLSAALAALGVYQPEARAFRPHVTIARVRGGRLGPGGLAQLGASRPAALSQARFEARTVTLFRSQTAPGGAVYTPLASAFLELPRSI